MVTLFFTILLGSAFPVSEAVNDQLYPTVTCVNDTCFVFWVDLRHYSPDRSVYAARVVSDGTVLDPGGCVVMRDRCEWVDADFDGVNFLAVFQDSC